jgi:hypothetical protein
MEVIKKPPHRGICETLLPNQGADKDRALLILQAAGCVFPRAARGQTTGART